MPEILELQLPQPPQKKYKIIIGSDLLNQLPVFLQQLKPVARYIIITDSIVASMYGKKLLKTLKDAGLTTDLLSFEAGGKNKNEVTHQTLTHAMLAMGCGRDTMILALGGGVVGDMAGYVAATYMRGISYVQLPTTFLAMVDSSIGGKVGVDTPYGKNLIGAFWHPEAVIVDTSCLKELPELQLINGLMESAKIFLTYDKKYFELLKKNWALILKKDLEILQKIIVQSIQLKMGVVVRDEQESNERMVVNWGHTIGHAIEHLSGFTLLHGICVALGVLVESKISQICGVLKAEDFTLIETTLKQWGIDEKLLQEYPVEAIVKQTMMDKKNRHGKARYVLLETIGKVKTHHGEFSHEVDNDIVMQALQYFIH